MIDFIRSNYRIAEKFFRDYGAYLTIPLNLLITISIITTSPLGWVGKAILDLFFTKTYLANYKKDPTKENKVLLIHMAVFWVQHLSGIVAWVFFRDVFIK